ncbi:MAG: tetratricopeptide repeat protein [Ahrensia sp.]|nr:tetratricopeptide repeat protein [Ahrensia sp.]
MIRFAAVNRMKAAKIIALSLALTAPFAAWGKETAKEETAEDFYSSSSLAGNYLAARIAATEKDTDFAVQFYRRALARDPDNPSLKYQAFLNFIANGDFEEGIRLGTDMAKLPEAPQVVQLILAADEIRKRNWAGASKLLEAQWRSPLDRLFAGLLQSWVQLAQDRTDDALASLDALEGPDWYDLFQQYHGGLIAMAAGRPEAAVKRLEEAMNNAAGGAAARETYDRVQLAFVEALRKSGDLERAEAVLVDILNRRPQNPVFERALANLQDKKPTFFDVSKPTRGAAEAFMNLGTAINREGGEQFARIYLQLASMLAAKDNSVIASLAELFDKEGKIVRANDLFGAVAPTSPYARFARLEYALNLDQMGKEDEARDILDELVEQHPDDIVVHLSYGSVLARHEKFDEAIEVYKPIIARIDEPERLHWNLFYRLGIAYERTKQWPLAEATFKKALELHPDQPSVLNYLGYSWVDMAINLQEGLDMIRKAVELRPNDGYMVDSLGWAYYRLNRFQEAVIELERAVELRPGDPTINDHLGDAYWRANRKLEATFQWRHALALDPPKDDIARIEEKLAKGLDAVLEREAAEKKIDEAEAEKEG